MSTSNRHPKSSHTLLKPLLAAITLTVAPASLLYAQNQDKPTYSPEVMAIYEANKKAQQAAAAKADIPLPVEQIDAEQFLNNPLVLSSTIKSTIWTVMPREGRQLIAIPIDFKDVHDDTHLRAPQLKIKTGSFLCWLIEEEAAAKPNGQQRNRNPYQNQQRNYGAPMEMMDMDPAMMGMDPGMMGIDPGMMAQMPERQQPRPQNQPNNQPVEEVKPEIPVDAPRVARSITINSDGSVTWGLERNIAGAEISNTNSLYALRIDAQLLNDARPLRPGEKRRSPNRARTTSRPSRSRASSGGGGEEAAMMMGMAGGGSNSRARSSSRSSSRSRSSNRNSERQRQREEAMKYREALVDYKELQKEVRELDDSFTLKKPAQIWAIYDLPIVVNDVSATTNPEWTLSFEDMEILQSTSKTNNSRRGQLDPRTYQLATDLQRLASEDNPFITKLVANAIYNSGSLPSIQENDTIYRLASRMIDSDDALVRLPIVKGLSEAIPPTPATLKLLKSAADKMGAEEQLLTLKSLIAVDTQDPIAVKQMLDAANLVLADAQGPDVTKVIDQIIETADSLGNKSDLPNILMRGLRFDNVPSKRLDKAIMEIAAKAGESDLAAGWMNHQLLGSANADLPKRTLQIINEIEAPKSELMDKAASKILSAFLGKNKKADKETTDKLELELENADALITAQIPIESTSHNIFRALNSGDDTTRQLAWKALKHFSIGKLNAKPQNNNRYQYNNNNQFNQNSDSISEVYQLILEAALRQKDTPDGIAYFFAKQIHEDPATMALVRLVVDGDDAAALEAAIKLRKSNRPIGTHFRNLAPSEREAFAKRIYQVLESTQPLATGLLRDPDPQALLANWFAQELAADDLPAPSKFAEVYSDDSALLLLAGSSDQVLASGAIAALVSSAGGDDNMQQKMAMSIASRPDRSVDALDEFWSNAKREIHTRSLQKAAGTYTLILLVRGGKEPQNTQNNNAQRNYQQQQQMPFDPSMMDPSMMDPELMAGMDPSMMGMGGPPQGVYNPQPQPRVAEPKLSEMPILREITVGTVELIVNAGTAHFDGDLIIIEVPQDFLGLTILDLNDLKNFNIPELDDINFDQSESESMDIRIDKDGKWRGQTRQLDGKVLEIILKPVEEN